MSNLANLTDCDDITAKLKPIGMEYAAQWLNLTDKFITYYHNYTIIRPCTRTIEKLATTCPDHAGFNELLETLEELLHPKTTERTETTTP
jgi:hypothetical protein